MGDSDVTEFSPILYLAALTRCRLYEWTRLTYKIYSLVVNTGRVEVPTRKCAHATSGVTRSDVKGILLITQVSTRCLTWRLIKVIIIAGCDLELEYFVKCNSYIVKIIRRHYLR